MFKFLKNLDRMAERIINSIDSDLQEPVVRIVTGEVFADAPTPAVPAIPAIQYVEIEGTPDAAGTSPAHPTPAPACDLTREPVLA